MKCNRESLTFSVFHPTKTDAAEGRESSTPKYSHQGLFIASENKTHSLFTYTVMQFLTVLRLLYFYYCCCVPLR